jgi:hypothetical protein
MSSPSSFSTGRFVVAMLLVALSPLSAQLPQAGARALALGYATTAGSTGYAAVAANPAGLAFPTSSSFSLMVPGVGFEGGLGPVGLDDLARWEGQVVPDQVKEEWLRRIERAGRQSGPATLGATPLAVSIGPVGFQLSTIAGGVLSLAPDAAELLLYGNAGRTGEPADFNLEGTRIDGYALSTAALAYGRRALDRLYLGITAKYSVGHALAVGRNVTGVVTGDPVSVELDIPLVTNRSGEGAGRLGSGFGIDLGALWEGDAFTLGATVQNVVQTFAWSLDRLSYYPGTMIFDQEVSRNDFEEQPAEAAPQSVRDVVDDFKPGPTFALGAAYAGFNRWTIQADVRKRSSGGLPLGPEFQAAVGVEFQAFPFLPLRAHGAVVSDGVQFGGGAAVVAGPVHLSAAGAVRTGGVANTSLFTFSVSFVSEGRAR